MVLLYILPIVLLYTVPKPDGTIENTNKSVIQEAKTLEKPIEVTHKEFKTLDKPIKVVRRESKTLEKTNKNAHKELKTMETPINTIKTMIFNLSPWGGVAPGHNSKIMVFMVFIGFSIVFGF